MTQERHARPRLAHPIVTTTLVAAVAFLLYGQVSAKVDTVEAQRQSRELAEPLDRLCRDDPTARERVGDADCDRAASVRDEPATLPTPRDGRDGRGIVATELVGGHLHVRFTDGAVDDLGVVIGAPGTPGAAGAPGRGIVATALVDDALVVTYGDGERETVGRVVGPVGPTGRGVARTEAVDGRLLVTYDDGATDDAGPLPVGPPGAAGPAGPAGRGVASLDLDLGRCELTVRYDDGTGEVRTVGGCEPSDAPTSSSTAPLPLPAS